MDTNPHKLFSHGFFSHWLFPPSIEAAKLAQIEMAQRVILEDDFELNESIGGMDLSCNPRDPEQWVYAAVVRLSLPQLELLDCSCIAQQHEFPYIPGLLGFREAPSLVAAFHQLDRRPDLLLVDGHGVSQPRGLGVASHLGVLLDMPTIGVAKSILVGRCDGELGESVGSQAALIYRGERIGMLLRNKVRTNPLVISTGHRVSLERAVEIVMEVTRGYRLPEPTRQAHLQANAYRTRARL